MVAAIKSVAWSRSNRNKRPRWIAFCGRASDLRLQMGDKFHTLFDAISGTIVPRQL
jgi:hypothetical protein